MELSRLNPNDLYTIAENMREWDKREIYATRWTDCPHDLARDAMTSYEFGWVASYNDRPVCAIGAIAIHPGVWSVWMFATDEFDKIKYSLTKFAARKLKPVLQDVGHRVECRSMEGHTDAQKWLEFLGMTRESSIPKYGRNGETFHLYAWTNPNLKD
jgi:hypothetical protein